MRVTDGGLILSLLLLRCDCLTADNGKSESEHQYGINKTTSQNEAVRLELKDNFQRSGDDKTTISSLADFPCPDDEAIAPCICIVDTDNKIYLDCTFVESEEQLAAVFEQEFPVKDLYEFFMSENSAVTLFPSFMNGVTFESLYLSAGPFALEGISNNFLLDMKNTLKYIEIHNSKLQTEFFPFYLLPLMNLQTLHFHGSDMNWIPQIRTPNLTYFGIDNAHVELLVNGTISIGTGDVKIELHHNQIRSIEPGSIFLADQNNSPTIYLGLYNNELTTVDEAVFGDLMPFMTQLVVHNNPLTCGCDIAWLVLNETYMSVVDTAATCDDGTNLHDLDPLDYLDFCRS